MPRLEVRGLDLEALHARDPVAAARALRIDRWIRPGERVRVVEGDPDFERYLNRRSAEAPDGRDPAGESTAPHHLIIDCDRIDDRALVERWASELREGGFLHLRIPAGATHLLPRGQVIRELRAVGKGGLLEEPDGRQSEWLLTLSARDSGTIEEVKAPLCLLFDQPRWLGAAHAKLRLALSALGFRLRDIDEAELILRGGNAAPRPDLEAYLDDRHLLVSECRDVGVKGSSEERRALLFERRIDPARRQRSRALTQRLIRGAAAVLDGLRPDLVVVVNGTNAWSRAMAVAARRSGAAVLALENSFVTDRFLMENLTGAVGNQHSLARFRFDRERDRRLDETEESRLDRWARERDTSSSFDGMIRQPEPAREAEIRESLGIPAGRPITLLLAQVAHDSVVTLDNPHFASSYHAYRAVIDDFARRHPDRQLVLRMHPKEAREGDDVTALRILADGELPANVSLVRGTAINTYSLMDIAANAVTINSQSGLEFLWREKPCLVLGDAFFGGKGFTIDLDRPEGLETAVDRLLEAPTLASEARRRMRRFLHQFVFEFAVPYALDGLADGLNRNLAELRFRTTARPPVVAGTGPLIDVIVVAERPADLTLESLGAQEWLTENFRVQIIDVHDLPADRRFLGRQLSIAIDRASSERIAIVPAPTQLQPQALKTMTFSQGQISTLSSWRGIPRGPISASWCAALAARLQRPLPGLSPSAAQASRHGGSVLLLPKALAQRLAASTADLPDWPSCLASWISKLEPRIEVAAGPQGQVILPLPESLDSLRVQILAELGLDAGTAEDIASFGPGAAGAAIPGAPRLRLALESALAVVERAFPTPAAAGGRLDELMAQLVPCAAAWLRAECEAADALRCIRA